MTRPAVSTALTRITQRTGVALEIDGATLDVGGHRVPLPARSAWDNLRMRHAFPYAARGDQREKLLFTAIQDAGPERTTPHRLDEELRSDLEDYISLPGARTVGTVADAMRGEYWTEPSKRPFLLPYHADLPLAYTHSVLVKTPRGNERLARDGKTFNAAQYRMFAGYILPFLCWDGTAVNTPLIDELLQVVASQDGLTLLDTLFLEAARALAGDTGELSSERLIDRAGSMLGPLENSSGGPFCQHSLALFQRDLATVIRMALPRADRIAAITQVISLHLATYYYRVALVLGIELETLAAATTGEAATPACPCTGLAACPLAGAIKMRAPTRGFRAISLSSPSRESYLALDRDRLLAMPANIIAANLLERAWAAVGGTASREGTPRPAAITAELGLRQELLREFDAAAAALSVLYAGDADAADSTIAHIAAREPGPFALQSAVIQIRRSRLKHTSRDVVHQLAHRPGEGAILRKNGSLYYFELDEDMLFLLVKLICQDETIALDTFLTRLAEYGLAPQDRAETDLLASRLEELGMLTRYSDAGESNYVRHIF
ncbi:MAG TPA: hypothetical protein VM324_14500 [Egibacteraceae bacterium]|nr:hypothetical protein [Egibacteraceae bacterium]